METFNLIFLVIVVAIVVVGAVGTVALSTPTPAAARSRRPQTGR